MVRLFALLCLLSPALAWSEDGNIPERFAITPDPEFRSLDEKVQTLKKDVFELSKDLSKLRETLLTPSSTKLNVFVSLEKPEGMVLDSVQLLVDDRMVSSYLYAPREQEALRQGGVQRLYTGNLPVGPHKLTAAFTGKDTAGKERRGNVTGNFDKSLTGKFFEIKISANSSDTPKLTLKEWE